MPRFYFDAWYGDRVAQDNAVSIVQIAKLRAMQRKGAN
jgi:hypothetical protein